MAGGGGTRLHPLSRPERPKPFLPLLGDQSLLQATARRRLPTDDITVVTDRRYERFVRDQLPDADLLLEPMGRNTAAAIALATRRDRPARRRGHARRPGRRPHRPGAGRGLPRGPADGRRAPRDRRLRHRRPARDAGHPGRPAPRPSTATCSRSSTAAPTIDGLRAYPLAAFEEKPKPARAEELQAERGRRLERGHLPVAAPGHPRGARALHRASSSSSSRRSRHRRCSSTPTSSSSPCRSTTRSWRARPATARS